MILTFNLNEFKKEVKSIASHARNVKESWCKISKASKIGVVRIDTKLQGGRVSILRVPDVSYTQSSGTLMIKSNVIKVENVNIVDMRYFYADLKNLYDAVKESKGDTFSIEFFNNNTFRYVSDNMDFKCDNLERTKKLKRFDGLENDFIDFDKFSEDLTTLYSFMLNTKDFRICLKNTVPFVTKDVTRFNINGVYLDLTKTYIRFVASDGKCMSMVDSQTIIGSCPDKGFIMDLDSSKALITVLKNTKESDVVLAIEAVYNNTFIVVKGNYFKQYIPIMNREYPDYMEIYKDLRKDIGFKFEVKDSNELVDFYKIVDKNIKSDEKIASFVYKDGGVFVDYDYIDTNGITVKPIESKILKTPIRKFENYDVIGSFEYNSLMKYLNLLDGSFTVEGSGKEINSTVIMRDYSSDCNFRFILMGIIPFEKYLKKIEKRKKRWKDT